MTNSTIKAATIITNIENTVVDYGCTGNGSCYCYDCGAAFLLDSAYVEVGKSASASCPECGGRCANPDIIGIKGLITGTWQYEQGIGDFFRADSGEEFYFSGADDEGENFFRGNKERPYLVHKGELLDWNKAVKLNSMIGKLTVGRLIYSDGSFAYDSLNPTGKYRWCGIVVREEEDNDVYKRYTVIPVE